MSHFTSSVELPNQIYLGINKPKEKTVQKRPYQSGAYAQQLELNIQGPSAIIWSQQNVGYF